MPVTVRINNQSGQTLRLGEAADWLTFSVETREGAVVPMVKDVPVVGPFELLSSQQATKRVDLAPSFPVSQPGRYNIIANVHIKEWDREIASPPRAFDIINGLNLWDQEFGLPIAPGQTNASPELRRYVLQQANYVSGQLRLYLRVTDHTGTKLFRLVRVGGMLSFSRPEHLLDQASNLHLLYQDAPHAFNYSVFTPDGELILRQTHDYIGSRPRLKVDVDGKIQAFGGVRRETATDVPPPTPIVPLEAPTPLSPPEEPTTPKL